MGKPDDYIQLLKYIPFKTDSHPVAMMTLPADNDAISLCSVEMPTSAKGLMFAHFSKKVVSNIWKM